MTINKSIINSYKLLYKYSNSNKFKPDKHRNFIHLYLLFIQNNYNIKFNFKNFTKSKSLQDCLHSLYESIDSKRVKTILFPEDDLLGSIFYVKENFNIEKFLIKLEEATFSLNYVNTNIQFIDFLGNTDNDLGVINVGLSYLLFLKQFPLIKINSKLQNNIIDNLVRTAQPHKGKINYINTQSLMILFLLKKVHRFPKLEEYIILLIKSQKDNGLLVHGFNSYLMENPFDYDLLHTCFGLIVLLEFQILKKYKEITSPSNKEIKEFKKDKNNKNNKNNKNDKNDNNNKKDKINNKVSSHNEVVERFDNINNITEGNFYFDLNFYNTTLILIIVLIAINVPRIKKFFD